MEKRVVRIPNMSCKHCVHTIETELSELNGIVAVKATLDSKELDINWEKPLDWNQIRSLLKEINYPPAE